MRSLRFVCVAVAMMVGAALVMPYAMAGEQDSSNPPADAVKTVVDSSAGATGSTVEGTGNVAQTAVVGTANAAGTVADSAGNAVASTAKAVTGQKQDDSKPAYQNQVEEKAKPGKTGKKPTNFAKKKAKKTAVTSQQS